MVSVFLKEENICDKMVYYILDKSIVRNKTSKLENLRKRKTDFSEEGSALKVMM